MDTQTTAPQAAEHDTTTGQQATQAARGVAGAAAQETQRTTREARDQARQLWSQTRTELADQAGAQQARAADGLRELARQLGSMAHASDEEGMARSLVEDVAHRAGEAAAWLDHRDPGALLHEVRDVARRRPGTFLAVAAGLGVVAGRLSRSLVDEAGAPGDPSERPVAPTPSTASMAGNGAGRFSGSGSTDAGVHRTTQPIAPDGTPTPIRPDGLLGVADDPFAGDRR